MQIDGKQWHKTSRMDLDDGNIAFVKYFEPNSFEFNNEFFGYNKDLNGKDGEVVYKGAFCTPRV